jgi:hypothetical protein
MMKPTGWRKEPARHALAAKGVRTKLVTFRRPFVINVEVTKLRKAADDIHNVATELDEMGEMRENDVTELKRIAALVRVGKVEAATRQIERLDTIVRDEVPDSFFELPHVREAYQGP